LDNNLKNRILFFGVLLLLVVLYTGGCRRAGQWLVKEELPSHADALVILMGNFPERVLQAADLYNEGRSDRILIVEESMGAYRSLKERGINIVSKTTQAVESCVALGVPAEKITVLPGDARSTLTEAVIIRDYLQNVGGIDSLVIVSSPYHLRRATLIFKKGLEKLEPPVWIGCSPSAYADYNAAGWWKQKEDIQDVLSELLKLLNFRLAEHWQLKGK